MSACPRPPAPPLLPSPRTDVTEFHHFRSSPRLLPFPDIASDARQVKSPFNDIDYRWQGTAILASQEATEARMIDALHDGQLAAFHAKRVTVKPADILLAAKLKGLDI